MKEKEEECMLEGYNACQWQKVRQLHIMSGLMLGMDRKCQHERNRGRQAPD